MLFDEGVASEACQNVTGDSRVAEWKTEVSSNRVARQAVAVQPYAELDLYSTFRD
jgi:hypothetical protein